MYQKCISGQAGTSVLLTIDYHLIISTVARHWKMIENKMMEIKTYIELLHSAGLRVVSRGCQLEGNFHFLMTVSNVVMDI